MARILAVDDDPFMRESLLDTLREDRHEIVAVESGSEALAALSDGVFDLALSDVKMPGMSGIEFLEQARQRDGDLPVIMITAHGTVETAVAAMKKGAFDFLLKPFGADELRLVLAKALEHRRLLGENEALRRELRRQSEDTPLLGISQAMARVRERISAIANSDATVLVRGETGTGKELVCRAIHYSSQRAERPFLCVNCAALSAGLLESELFGHERGAFTGADRPRAGRFEMAEGGTLLLDEVSEIDINLQAKLLRVLQEKEFERVGSSKTRRANVRILATTNRDLEGEVRQRGFREDLYYRLNIVPIVVPPLRERKDDIPLLSAYFLERAQRRSRTRTRPLAAESRQAMQAYHWPGNVRELENLIERAVLLSRADEIELEDLGASARATPFSTEVGSFRGQALEEVEKAIILDTLQMYGGHQRKSAESLGIGIRTLRDKIKKWGLRVGRGEKVLAS